MWQKDKTSKESVCTDDALSELNDTQLISNGHLSIDITDSDSRWLLSIYSITDFVGRILPGWLSHWNLVSDKSIYIISISVMGLCMALLVVAHSWIQFVLLSLLCGLVTGCQMVLSPAILSDYLGTENTAVAFGMSNFICGAITLATRPLIIGMYRRYNYLIQSISF